jgi:glycosyltransferase involved in cell wall biosynthesis
MSDISNNPLVSIIVRTKDRPKLLKKALQSIAAQTYRPIEVILVNDGGCGLDVEELKAILGDVSLNYVRLEKNTGRAHAGNAGIENAKGDYIGFLDDDDELYPEHVSVLVGYLEQSDLKVAYTDSLMVYKEYNSQTQELSDIRKELVYSQDFDYEKLIFENYIPFMCLLFVRDVLLNSGGLDSRFDLFEDYDLLIRIGENYPFYHIRKITAEYNQWCSAFQISQRNKNINFLRESYLKLFSKHIDKFTPERIYNYRSATSIAKDAHIKNLETLIKDKDNHIGNLETLETLIKDKDNHIGNLETLIKDKDIYIRNLQDVIKGKDQYITSGVPQLKQREQHINSLESTIRDKDAVLNNIYSSHGWKALLVYYRIRDKILPANSIRRRAIKRVFNLLLLLPQHLLKKKNQLRES